MATSEARASLVFSAVPVAATGDAPGDAAVSPPGLVVPPVGVLGLLQAATRRAVAGAEMAGGGGGGCAGGCCGVAAGAGGAACGCAGTAASCYTEGDRRSGNCSCQTV